MIQFTNLNDGVILSKSPTTTLVPAIHRLKTLVITAVDDVIKQHIASFVISAKGRKPAT